MRALRSSCRWLGSRGMRGCATADTAGKSSVPLTELASSPSTWFEQFRADTLRHLAQNTNDKSLAGRVDPLVLPLVTAINAHAEMVTLSSCSGRLTLFHRGTTSVPVGDGDATSQLAKRGALGRGTLFQTHDPILDKARVDVVVQDLMTAIDAFVQWRRGLGVSVGGAAVANELLQFKFEPMILHIMVGELEHATRILNAASESGQRRSGILAVSRCSGAQQKKPQKITVNVTSALCFDVPLFTHGSFALLDNREQLEVSIRDWTTHASSLFSENTVRMERFQRELSKRFPVGGIESEA